MAEIKNTFIKSKMNKDLDDRLVPNGEYRDALNIAISRSEGDDVGALETILGNELYFGEDTYRTCIGLFSDTQNQIVYYFVTDYIDSSTDGTSNFAPSNAYCAVVMYNSVTTLKTVLVEGQFLNFSARSPITGVNIIEDLLFWTDNRNQPRKINISRAKSLPAAQPEGFRLPLTIPTPYYTSEDQISVAKYYPWKPISLLDLYAIDRDNYPLSSTMTNPAEEFYPNGTSAKPDYDSNWPGDPDYLSDKFIKLSYRFKFDDNEYSLMAPFTQACFVPKQYGYFLEGDQESSYRSTVVDFFENNVTQIIASIEFESINPLSDLRIKELEILYKESDALQVKVVESIPIQDVVRKMASNANPYVYDYKYISTKPYKGLPENQITRVFDQVPTRALAQEVSGNRIIYGNFVTTQSAPRNIDYNIAYGNKRAVAFGGTNQVEYPNHTLKQNRNYQVGFILADRYGRQSSVILSSNDTSTLNGGVNYGGSTIYVPYKPDSGFSPMDWPGYSLSTLINSPIPDSGQTIAEGYPGLYKDENKGVDALTITNGGGAYGLTIGASTTGGSGTGLTVDITENVGTGAVVTVVINNPGTGYIDGETVTIVGGNNSATLKITVLQPNPLGWYSYKIVVRQTEQDYYNVYLPGILNGYPSSYVNSEGVNFPIFERDDVANIVLINDNINKVPRDLEEVGPDQKQYRSAVELYGRVAPYQFSTVPPNPNYNKQYYPSNFADSVVSISTLSDTNYNNTTLTGSDPLNFDINYKEFYQSNTNPLIARINTIDPIGKGTVSDYSYTLAVYETEPVESLLDIYWETTSTGLIKELNTAIQSGGYEGAVQTNGYQFILAEDSLPGTNCFNGSVQVVNGFGNVITDDIEFELVSVLNRFGDNITDEFVLVTSGAGGGADPKSFNVRSAAISSGDTSDSYFYYGPNPLLRNYIMNFRCIYTNPSTTEQTVSNIVLRNLLLENRPPIMLDVVAINPIVTCFSTEIPTCAPIEAISIQTSETIRKPIYTFGAANGSLCTGGNYTDDLNITFPGLDTTRFEVDPPNPGLPGIRKLWLKQNAPVSINPITIKIWVQDAGGETCWCGGVVDNLPYLSVSIYDESNAPGEVTPLTGSEIPTLKWCDIGPENGGDPFNTETRVGSIRYRVIWSGLIDGQTYNPVFTIGPTGGYWGSQGVSINNQFTPQPTPFEVPDGQSSACLSPIVPFVAPPNGIYSAYFDVDFLDGATSVLNFSILGTGLQPIYQNWIMSTATTWVVALPVCVSGACIP